MSSVKGKTRILLVVIYNPGAIGGQATSARLLLAGLKNEIAWSVVSLPSPGLKKLGRVLGSLRVFFQSFFICLVKRIQVAHIFYFMYQAGIV